MATKRDRVGWATPALLGLFLLAPAAARGSADPPVEGRKPAVAERPKAAPTDQFGFEVPKFQPSTPPTPQEKAKTDAMAYYMAGRLKQSQSKFRDAFNEYQKALKLDPKASEVYRALVPLSFALDETEKGLEFALEAIKVEPQDLEILKLLADQLHDLRRFDEAIVYLERATKSTRLKRDTAMFVILHLQLATFCREVGKFDKAADSYEIVYDARRNPGKYSLDFQTRSVLEREPLARFETMGDVFLQAGRTDKAIQAIEAAIKAKGGKPGALSYSLAEAYFRAKKYDDAAKHLQAYLDAELQGKGRRPYELLAKILKETGKPNELLPRIEALAAKDIHNSNLQYFLADQFIAANRLEDAEKLILKVLKETGETDGYIGLASVYSKQNKGKELLEALAKGLKGQGGRERSMERLESVLNEIQKDRKAVDGLIDAGRKKVAEDKNALDFFGAYIVGRLALRTEQVAAAIEFYKLAIAKRREIGSRLSFELAEFLVTSRKFAEAAGVLKDALAAPAVAGDTQADQLKLEMFSLLARAQALEGQIPPALEAIRSARKIDADNLGLAFWEAWIYSHSHQWEESIRRYEALIAKHSSNPKLKAFVRRCQFSLSNCHVQKGDIAVGEKILEAVHTEQPNDPSVNNDLGYLYADQGKRLEQAEQMIKRALQSEPDNAAYLDSMGWVLFKLGRAEEARPYLEKAVAKPTGSDATIFEHLGDCYAKLTFQDKAIDAWKKAIKDAKSDSFPDQKLIRRLEEKLKNAPADAKAEAKPQPAPSKSTAEKK